MTVETHTCAHTHTHTLDLMMVDLVSELRCLFLHRCGEKRERRRERKRESKEREQWRE